MARIARLLPASRILKWTLSVLFTLLMYREEVNLRVGFEVNLL